MTLRPLGIAPHLRPLSSAGITRPPRYYGPLRDPAGPTRPSRAVGWRVPRHRSGLPVLRSLSSSMRAAANTPAEPVGACVAHFPTGSSLPRYGVGCGKGRNDTLSLDGPLFAPSKPCLRVHDKHFFVVNRCVTRSRCRFWRKIFPTSTQISFYEKKGWRSIFQTERRSHHALRIGSGIGKDRGSVHGGSALPHARPQPARW